MTSLYAELIQNAKSHPDRVALVGFDLSLTNQEAADYVAAAISWMSQRGIKAGGQVALRLSQEVEWIFLIALDGLGATASIIRTNAQLSQLERWGFDFAILNQPGGLAGKTKELVLGAGELKPELSQVYPEGYPWPADQVYRILFTSGTSGNQKAVPLEKYKFDLRVQFARKGWLEAHPMMTLFGLDVSMSQLLMAHSILDLEPFIIPSSAGFASQQLDSWKLRAILGSESQFRQLLAEPRNNRHQPQRILLGGSFPSQQIRDELSNAYPDSQLWVLFGSTEAGQTFIRELDSANLLLGHPASGVEVVLPEGSAYEFTLEIKSPAAATKYLDDPIATEKHFSYGVFRSGDLVSYEPDAGYFLAGRNDTLINLGGKKIDPEAIEHFVEKRIPGLSVLLRKKANQLEMLFEAPFEMTSEAIMPIIIEALGTATQVDILQVRALPRSTTGKKIRK